jgi:hypothetical protein
MLSFYILFVRGRRTGFSLFDLRRGTISMTRSLWRDSLLAVLAGNVIYFLLVAPRLPEHLRHHAFQLDPGLLIDFMICILVFAVVRSFRKPSDQ